MAPRTINPDPVSLERGAIYPEAGAITITLRTCRPSVSCPDCDQPTEQVHSWYQRTLTDLPWQGLAVRFRLHTRRWRCPNPSCGRQIFTERLPEVVVPFARRTVRLAEVVDTIAFALGGEAGARVLATLGLPVSPDTLLNRVRAVEMPTCPTPRVIGIDDWAWRKGNRYGTIIVDLERHRVIDLLPDRDVETIVSWLRRQRHARLIDQYEAIQRLHRAGADVADIARTVGVSRRTVYRYRALPEPPMPKQPHRRWRVLDLYEAYLLRRWQEGCHNGRRLWREIREYGFAYGESNVERGSAPLRRAERDGQPVIPTHRHRQQPTPTASHVAGLFLRRPEHVTGEEQRDVDLLGEQDAAVAALQQLTRAFATMVRERRGSELDTWLESAQTSGSAPLRRFAAGLVRDLDAVRAGLTEPWSHGQTESQIHRVKLPKRQMYGWARFAVVRNRVLHAA